MTVNPRLKRIVAAQPYALLVATISGAHVLPLTSPRPSLDQMRRARAAWRSEVNWSKTRASSKGWLAEPKSEVMLSPPPLLSYGATAFARTEAVGEGWR